MEPVEGQVITLVEDVHFEQVFLLNGSGGANGIGGADSGESVKATVINEGTTTTVALPDASNYHNNHQAIAGAVTEEENCNSEGTWTGEATRLLLTTVEDLMPRVGTLAQLKTKTKMWAYVANNVMKRHSYTFTAVQCQNRWKTLVRGYRRRIKNNGNGLSTSSQRTNHYFERKLEDILSKKHPSPGSVPGGSGVGSPCPVEIRGEPATETSPRGSSPEDEEDDDDEEESYRPTNGETRAGCGRATIAGELRRLRWQRAAHHAQLLELADRKRTAYKERTAELRRKNDLLEQLVRIMSKS